jgi:DNA-binding IclR family transcriptional regulator
MYVQQAANVLVLLEYFARRHAPARIAEIADELGWPRSSTFNIVSTLVDKGFLYESQARSGYYPTPRWLALAQEVSEAEPLAPHFVGLAAGLARETGETAAISAPAGTHAIFMHVAESTQPVRYFAQVGDRVPIQASSAGRALLEQHSRAERDSLYRKIRFQSYSPTSPKSPGAVERELAAAKRRGYHQSNAEYTPDLAGVALALPGPRRLSIVVVGPVSRCLHKRPETAALMRKRLDALAR